MSLKNQTNKQWMYTEWKVQTIEIKFCLQKKWKEQKSLSNCKVSTAFSIFSFQ